MHLCIVIEKEKETKEIYVLFDHFKIWPRSYERSGEGSRIRLSPRNRGMFSGLSPFVHYVWIKIICRMFKYSQLVCWLTKWLNKLYIYLIISFEKRQHFRHYKYRSWDWGDLLKNIEFIQLTHIKKIVEKVRGELLSNHKIKRKKERDFITNELKDREKKRERKSKREKI